MRDGERHLLFLAHRVPYPPDKGDKIRSHHEIRHLSARGWCVHLCALADDAADLRHVPALERYCSSVAVEPISPRRQRLSSVRGPMRGRPLSVAYFYRGALQRRVDAVLDRHPIRAILCFCGPMAEYVFRSKSGRLAAFGAGPRDPGVAGPPLSPGAARRPTTVMDLVDVDSEKWAQYSRSGRPPMRWVYALEGRLLSRYEKRVAESFDATALVSAAEVAVFRQRSGVQARVHAIGNGVDLEYFHSGGRRSRTGEGPSAGGCGGPPRLVFCGAMDYYPNVDAVVWFAREVLPLVRRTAGQVELVVVGSKPTSEVRALEELPGVRVTGRVDDVRPYVWGADLSIAPLRVARGVQNKVLEAMALGTPVVSTPEAFEGIEAVAGRDLVVAPAEPGAFAGAVADLLADGGRAAALASRGRAAVEERYRWEDQMSRLEGLLAGEGRP